MPTTSPSSAPRVDTKRGADTDAGTATRILDAAERIVQARGFNAFSYGDVAVELGITTAALHYHYPRKAELGRALITRYTSRFAARLEALDDSHDSVGHHGAGHHGAGHDGARSKLDGYVGIYAEVLAQGKMCLCGILAAEYLTLSASMQAAVREFFEQNEAWLSQVLNQGQADGSMSFTGEVSDVAKMIISCLEGAMLVSMAYDDVDRFMKVATSLLASLY